MVYEFSSIDMTSKRKIIKEIDYFTLMDYSAKWDPIPTMLVTLRIILSIWTTLLWEGTRFTTFDVEHGNILVSAIKVNNILYTPDISALKNDDEIKNLDYLTMGYSYARNKN